YHLIPSSGLPFVVQYDINRGDLSLIVHEQLDREKDSSYTFLLVASDGGNQTGFVRIFVTIQDVNDHSPIFDKSHYYSNISENSPIGTVLVQVHANDFDEGRNAQLTYQLLSSSHDETTSCFDLNENTGQIRLTCQLDYEYRQQYSLEIEAKDDGEGSKTGYCTVHVNVVNVNDNRPLFQLYPSQLESIPYSSSHEKTNVYTQIDQEHIILYLSESFQPNTVLFSFIITDNDFGDSGQVTWKLVNNNSNQQLPFDISRAADNAGDLRLIQSLDRESIEQYKFGIMASDNGNPRLTTVLDIHVIVTDVNDVSPKFLQQNMTATVNEHVSISDTNGYEVYHVQAYDSDKGLNGKIEYQIITTDNDIKHSFTIDQQTGIIRAIKSFDREIRDKYAMEVEARDKGNLSRASRTNIVFFITDQNDHAPMCYDLSDNQTIDQSKIKWLVKESSAYGTIIGRIQCHDVDIGQNGLLGYNIHYNDSETMTMIPFSINSQNITKTISQSNQMLLIIFTVNGIMDRELKSTYDIFIQVFDNGNPRHLTFIPIIVAIVDVDDKCAKLDSLSKTLVMINRDLIPIFNRQLYEKYIRVNENITFDLININPIKNSYYVKLYSNGSLVIHSSSIDDGYLSLNIQIKNFDGITSCIVLETIVFYIGSNDTDWTSSKLTQDILLRTNETHGKRNSNSRSANYNTLSTTEQTFFKQFKNSTPTKSQYIIIIVISLSIFIFVLVFATIFCMIDRIFKKKKCKSNSSQNGHILKTHITANGINKQQQEKNGKRICSPNKTYDIDKIKSPSKKRLTNDVRSNSSPPSPANYIRLNATRTTPRLNHSSRSNSIMSNVDLTAIYTRGYSYTPIEIDDFYPPDFNDNKGIELRMTTV
ncbi:unnamed protein product, partial [Didymodactylos carnosus]